MNKLKNPCTKILSFWYYLMVVIHRSLYIHKQNLLKTGMYAFLPSWIDSTGFILSLFLMTQFTTVKMSNYFGIWHKDPLRGSWRVTSCLSLNFSSPRILSKLFKFTYLFFKKIVFLPLLYINFSQSFCLAVMLPVCFSLTFIYCVLTLFFKHSPIHFIKVI